MCEYEDENGSDDIYEKVDKVNLERYFEGNLSRQRKLYSVLPTMNNIESSRGHTLVLLKLKIDSHDRYYPLVDMAGTENPGNMQVFNNDFTNSPNTNYFVETIQKLNFYKDIYHKKTDNSGKFNSLKEVKDDKAKFKTDGNETISYNIKESDLKNKIINEGYYINHTIASLVLTIMFISNLIKLPKIKPGEASSSTDDVDKKYDKPDVQDNQGKIKSGCDILQGNTMDTIQYTNLNSTYKSIKTTLGIEEKYSKSKYFYKNEPGFAVQPEQPEQAELEGGNINNENIFNFNDFLKQTINGQYGGSGDIINENCGKNIVQYDKIKDQLNDEEDSKTKFLGNFADTEEDNLYKNLLTNGSLWMQFIFSFLFWNSLKDSAAIKKLENIIDAGIKADGNCAESAKADFDEISEIKEIFKKKMKVLS